MAQAIIYNPVSDVVRNYLITNGVTLAYDPDVDWCCAVIAEPVNPVNVITVFDEAEQKVSRPHSTGSCEVADRPVVGIRVRAADAVEGQRKAKLIMEKMDLLRDYVWSGGTNGYEQTVLLRTAIRQRGILPLGRDDNGRWVFNMEYALVVQSIENQ